MHVLANQNSDLKNQQLKVDFNEDGEWIELNIYHTLLNNFKHLQEEYSILKSDLESLQTENESLKEISKENSQLHSDIIEYKSKIAENDNLQNTLAEKNLTITNLNNEIHEIKEILEFKNESLKELTAKIENYKLQLSEIDILNSQINDYKVEIEKLKQEISEKIWIITELENSLNDKRQNSDVITKNNQILDLQIIELQNEVKSKENDFFNIRAQKEKLEAELTKVKITNRDLQKKLETIENEKSDITLFDTQNDELEHYKKEKANLLNKLKEITDLNNKYKNELQKTRSGLLPLDFGGTSENNNDEKELRAKLDIEIKFKENLENRLINLENLLILKSEELQQLNKEFINYKEETIVKNNKVKSKILDLKKFMLDKGII
jgi:chromosome segregation ATPase